MNDFAKFFLNEDWKSVQASPRVFVGAFGKHPGWNDHMDPIGLVTTTLVEAREIIYGGIAHQIEHASWQKLGPEKTLPGFEHIIHWRRLNESLTGLAWSSQDGKGRALYPMIVLAHSVTRSFSWLANELLPALDEVKAQCRETTSASVVNVRLQAVEKHLRSRLPDGSRVSTGPGLGVPAWAAYFDKNPEALRRVFHHLRRNCAAFAPGAGEWCKGDTNLSRTLRLPQIPGAKPAESLNAWISFLAVQLDPVAPFLGLLPVGEKWLDIIVGEPTADDFRLLRTRASEAPVVTDIPYELDPGVAGDDAKLMAVLGLGLLPEVSCLNGQTAAASREAAAKWLLRFRPGSRPGFFKRLFSST